MRAIHNRKPITENFELLQAIIGKFLDKLNSDPTKNRQKILEVCHAGKFLMTLGNGDRINRLFEKPDFIFNVDGNLVGLEHQIVIDPKSKEREGFFENIFSITESELQTYPELPNFLANCYLKNNLTFRLSDKTKLIQEIKLVVKHFILNNALLPNSLINEVSSMPHSKKNISPNFGAWWQKEITTDVLLSSISSKESRIHIYKENSVPNQWLLLVIGSLQDSSYEMPEDVCVELDTKFDKVYPLEDFRARLFELK